MKILNYKFELWFLAIFASALVLFLLYQNIFNIYSQHHSIVAESIIHGHLDLTADRREKFLDTDVINGKTYYTGDPGTSFFMVPLAFIFSFIKQIPPQWPLNIISLGVGAYFLNKILTLKQVKGITTRIWLILAFFFGTSLVSIIYIPNTWNLAQTLGISLSLLYIYEFLSKKRMLLLLPLMILITFTRKQLIIPIFLFAYLGTFLEIGQVNKQNIYKISKRLGLFLLTAYIALHLYAKWYNTMFADPIRLDSNSFSYSLSMQKGMIEKYGLANTLYFARNFYAYFLKMPDPVPQSDISGSNLKWPFISPSFEGTSFFILSPIFLAFFFFKFPEFKSAFPGLFAGIILLLLYLNLFTSGQDQFGLRYSADIIPFLFLPLIDTIKNNLNTNIKALIAGSILFNCFLLIAFFASGKTI